jgi:hypothetical protein
LSLIQDIYTFKEVARFQFLESQRERHTKVDALPSLQGVARGRIDPKGMAGCRDAQHISLP